MNENHSFRPFLGQIRSGPDEFYGTHNVYDINSVSVVVWVAEFVLKFSHLFVWMFGYYIATNIS